ncbi:hypothetical protein J4460_02240 [Candidatus Woesearchaeota archaeon]|nr:MAG: hypothetical protein QS99_C0004G0014 [archaeon GW2011_AR4]MBS3129472.1 hypothetical protein [Candidatus Woesearchaeota archaeon]HIH38908.1 hypothetical protein [Candidatus Woesearchaeota archaeon]HIH49678.1 hypothetical protein [Candidatus Woesearchaeota archaeon]HIJ03759.1 hypothetical protein [Candidatus Woesearchaeota archaeon]
MIFAKDYFNPLDRPDPPPIGGTSVHDIGMSVVAGISGSGTELIGAAIRQGVGQIHIEMSGVGKGSAQAQTPGMYGRELRQAMKDLAEVNEVTLTHHAPFNIMGYSGQDQQGNFSDEQRKFFVDELKRNIDFSADLGSDAVTLHTGEFKRPISEQPWAKKDNKPGHYFRQFEEEPQKAHFVVVDDRSGRAVRVVEKSEEVARPKWKQSDHGYTYVADKLDEIRKVAKAGEVVRVNPNDYIDYEGKRLRIQDRVPLINPNTGRFDVEIKKWNQFEDEAKEYNKHREMDLGRPLRPEERFTPEEAFMRATMEIQEGHSKGWALQYAQDFSKNVDRLAKLKKAKETYQQLEKTIPETEKWRLLRNDPEFGPYIAEFIPPDKKYPSEILDEQITNMRRQVEFASQASTSQQQQAIETYNTMQHLKSASKYALEKSALSYAEAGIHAMKQSKEKPVYIALEHIFPESYGGHPQELKHLVLASRKKMSQVLQEQGYSKPEAEKAAENHIKATFDTGHLNLWRRFWRGSDEDFKKWMMKETEEIAKSGIVGQLHLADNFGYHDDHLTPGQGTTPVKEMVEMFKKYGYDKYITVEPGADATVDVGAWRGMTRTWSMFDSPIYGAQGAQSFTRSLGWTDVQSSYFGQTYAPRFIFGQYSPSNDWTLWTQVPLE